MRLHRLELTAFGPFAATQRVDFDELSAAGLFLLHGPTGSGKTSVLDGVCFALYGQVPGARPATRLRSDHAADGAVTEVVLELTVGGRRWEITRRPEHQRAKKRGSGTTTERAVTLLREHIGGEWRALSKSHQEVGEEIKQLVGMSCEQFCQVVLLPQGEFATFLRATATERADLLGRLFDTRRFRSVERWLRDRKQDAGQRLDQGDRDLTHLAERMRQEAGADALPLAAWLPEGAAPGHPDYAPGLLEWAAILRCTAREQYTVAASAVARAEAAHTAAAATAAAQRDLHALQRRHAAARERADALALSRDTRTAARARLAAARRATTVEPALALCDKAALQHDEAGSARDAALAALTGPGADGPAAAAEALVAEERRLREELGALAGAAGLEERVREIARRRAEVEREERGDEDAVREAETWLEGWPAMRAAAQGRLDDAQEAAARVGGLGAELDRAERRLAAGAERDALARESARADDARRDARDRVAGAREAWQDLREARITGIAAELAAELTDGEPCRVCGSATHPAPALPSPRQVTRADEDAAHERYQRESAGYERAGAEAVRLRTALDAAAATAGDAPHAELAAAHAELAAEHTRAARGAAELPEARRALAVAEEERDRRTALRAEALRRAAARTSRREELDRQHTQLTAELTAARGGHPSVAARRDGLAARIALLDRAVHAVRARAESGQRLTEARTALADAAVRAGFASADEAAAALLTSAELREAERREQEWAREEAGVEADLAAPEPAAAALLPPADPAAAQAAAEAATLRLRNVSATVSAAASRCTELDRLGAAATAATRELAPARAAFARIKRLSDLASANSAENQYRMELETYVLAARLEQVAAAAAVRLQRMSAGRYTLVHSDARGGGRSKSGLGLMVVDAWTGTERDTATLSGGETFFASLALALGLADVVTDEAGGTRLDTLFIDEGFGSLDDQTLDEVLDVLDGLRERDRAVGIVSHVADLRHRIPAQLRVVKGRDGSRVSLRTAVLPGPRTGSSPAPGPREASAAAVRG
ncbi:SMC family ATPase [Streptomyces sp. NPDC051976]|uniref:SMC family ATPase n=1 Tax=Streptomyces sp. NPDC051976 TaxID=3154947 RepID=UPI003437D9C8